MAHPKIEAFMAHAPGTAMDPDRSYGYQCVDLADYYAEFLFGVRWQDSMGWVTGAKQHLDAAPDKYWIRIDNSGDPNQIPQRGDVIVWAGDAANQWGHVAVVISADVNGVDVIQQDGFAKPHQFVNGGWYSAKPAHHARLGYTNHGTGYTLGWLRPRLEPVAAPAPTPAPAPASIAEYQRTTNAVNKVAYREHPAVNNTNIVSWLNTDTIYDFGGFVRGEEVTVDGFTSNVWFKGKHTGKYSWSGGFTNSSTAGLPDLSPETTPAAIADPNVRTTGTTPVNLRTGPSTANGLLKLESVPDGVLKPSHDYIFKGFVRAKQEVGGTNIWLVSRSGGYAHINGFTNTSTDGLPELPSPDADVAPATPEAPVAPATPTVTTYSFNKDLPCVTEVKPARVGHFQADGLPKRPLKVVVHQYDASSKGVQADSVISWFQSPNNDQFSSAHFVIQGPRIVQMVALKDRAYHAGKGGNDYIGVETYVTNGGNDQATFNSLITLIKELEAHYEYTLEIIDHKSVSATSCGTEINIPAITAAVRKVEAPVAPATSTAPAPVAPATPSTPVNVAPATSEVELLAECLKAAIDSFLQQRKAL